MLGSWIDLIFRILILTPFCKGKRVIFDSFGELKAFICQNLGTFSKKKIMSFGFFLMFQAILCRKVENTIFGYKKWSKSKSEKSDQSANPTLYIVSLYDFAYNSVWIDPKKIWIFLGCFRLFCVEKYKIQFLVAKSG